MTVDRETFHTAALMRAAMNGSLTPFLMGTFDGKAFVGAVSILVADVVRHLPPSKRRKMVAEIRRSILLAVQATNDAVPGPTPPASGARGGSNGGSNVA